MSYLCSSSQHVLLSACCPISTYSSPPCSPSSFVHTTSISLSFQHITPSDHSASAALPHHTPVSGTSEVHSNLNQQQQQQGQHPQQQQQQQLSGQPVGGMSGAGGGLGGQESGRMRGVQFPFVVNDFVLIKVSEHNRAMSALCLQHCSSAQAEDTRHAQSGRPTWASVTMF